MNYFDLLGLKQSYNIDINELKNAYFDLQLSYHPDRSINEEDRKSRASISVDLNKAYSIIKNDLSRAEYLLSLYNISLNDINEQTLLSKLELSLIWEEMERIEELKDSASLIQLYNLKRTARDSKLLSLTEAFNNHNLTLAINITVELKYLNSIINAIELKIQ